MVNPYRQAQFAFSANHRKQLPPEDIREVAFVGRSNAGKSSALNALTGQKNLARVSKTPGRTQLINYFSLPNAGHYLVDLPGYGYADVPEAIRSHWQKLLGEYLLEREQLHGVVLLMDIRHPLKDLDRQMLDCCASRQLQTLILLTKCDKFSASQQQQQLRRVASELTASYAGQADISLQLFSSLKKTGLEALVQWLNECYGGANDA